MGMMQAERSAGASSSHRSIFTAMASKFSCVTGTHLEVSVVPEVRKMAAQECAGDAEAGLALPTALTCRSATSVESRAELVIVKRPQPSPAALSQLGSAPSPDTIK